MSGRGDDPGLSIVAVVVTAALGLPAIARVTTPRPRAAIDGATPAPMPARGTPANPLEVRVAEIAEAVALAEGYFAVGDHDGHSLPYRLNNPGALKKPALGAAALPTWKDTGLVEFPTADAGWRALRHQLRAMLTGQSRIYESSDTLWLVAQKYADGDVNWGVNVAAALGVEPGATLMELAPNRK